MAAVARDKVEVAEEESAQLVQLVLFLIVLLLIFADERGLFPRCKDL